MGRHSIFDLFSYFFIITWAWTWLTHQSPHSSWASGRQLSWEVPEERLGVRTLAVTPNATIRYKEPKICESTAGVKSYSGFVDLDSDSHTFFWFFEARHNPQTAPITLWLNGGPGSDSLMGLFQGDEATPLG